jgi:hypothetical protein
MSVALSFRSVTDSVRFDGATGWDRIAARFRRALDNARRRGVETRIALAVQATGHDGVLADFHRARMG